MYSIRRRLMLVLAAGFGVLIVGAGLYVHGLLGERVTEDFDDVLVARTRALGSLIEQEDGQIEFDYTPSNHPEFAGGPRSDYFQVWLDDGTVLYRSRGLKPDHALPWDGTLSEQAFVRDVTLPDGRAGRQVQIAFVPQGPDETASADRPPLPVAKAGPEAGVRGIVLVMAHGRDRLDGLIARMRLAIFGTGGVAMFLAAVLVWRAVVTGFRPIELIAAQVGALDASNLDARVTLAKTPREVAPIVSQINALLDRLSASFERERRFTGYVAHELRTPIAELRALAEVAGRWPDDREAVARFFGDVGAIAGRMETMVADLLLLARCQAGVETTSMAPTSLRGVVTASWSKLAAGAEARGLGFRLDLPDDLSVVESDPGKLAILFSNVLGNAVSYATAGTEIRCTGARNGSTFSLEVANAAPRLEQEDLRNLAEPFWRKDEARSSSRHAGLGLSVVSSLADLLRLKVGFDQAEDGTFRVRIEGPAPS